MFVFTPSSQGNGQTLLFSTPSVVPSPMGTHGRFLPDEWIVLHHQEPEAVHGTGSLGQWGSHLACWDAKTFFFKCHFHGFTFACVFLCLSFDQFKKGNGNRVCVWRIIMLKRQDWYPPMKVCNIITTRPAAEIWGLSLILSQLLIPSCQSAGCYLRSQTGLIETETHAPL